MHACSLLLAAFYAQPTFTSMSVILHFIVYLSSLIAVCSYYYRQSYLSIILVAELLRSCAMRFCRIKSSSSSVQVDDAEPEHHHIQGEEGDAQESFGVIFK